MRQWRLGCQPVLRQSNACVRSCTIKIMKFTRTIVWNDLMSAFRDVVNRAEQFASHHVDREGNWF